MQAAELPVLLTEGKDQSAALPFSAVPAPFVTLKIEAVYSYETLVPVYQMSRRHIPQDSNRHLFYNITMTSFWYTLLHLNSLPTDTHCEKRLK
jgi:hypothetical protein